MAFGSAHGRRCWLWNAHRLCRLGFALSLLALLALPVMYPQPAQAVDPQHHARCDQNAPSKTRVRPGETFTATVRMFNNGSSTFHPGFGFYLAEYNGGLSNTWKAGGTGLSGPVAPGGTATFQLTLTAPAATGIYDFNWAMAIAGQGAVPDPCSSGKVSVLNPPAVTLNANSQGQDISLPPGSGLTLNWGASNQPQSCTASGTWGGGKAVVGSENRSGDTASPGVKTYTLTCTNGVASTSITRRVTVGTAGTAPKPAAPAPSRSPATPTVPPPAVLPAASADVPAPAAPTNFSALPFGTQAAVKLSWSKPENPAPVKGYLLERSTDQSAWETLAKPDELAKSAYTDRSTAFETRYYYRLQAIGQNDKPSGYTTIEFTTPPFEANTLATEAVTLASESGKITVTIPEGAITEEAHCSIDPVPDSLPPGISGFEAVAGPYGVVCKTPAGDRLTDFKKPLLVSVTMSREDRKKYGGIKYYASGSDWQERQATVRDELGEREEFELDKQTTFAVMGQIKSSLLWKRILLGLVVAAGSVWLVSWWISLMGTWRGQRKLQRQYDEYYRKEHGL